MENDVLRFENPNGSHSLILDDDGRTCYAYLLNDQDQIVGDCWLYNRGAAPLENEWNSPEKMPFANSVAYIKPEYVGGIDEICTESSLSVNWTAQGAEILLQERLFARLVVGAKPGWSVLAAKDGPIALLLPD